MPLEHSLARATITSLADVQHLWVKGTALALLRKEAQVASNAIKFLWKTVWPLLATSSTHNSTAKTMCDPTVRPPQKTVSTYFASFNCISLSFCCIWLFRSITNWANWERKNTLINKRRLNLNHKLQSGLPFPLFLRKKKCCWVVKKEKGDGCRAGRRAFGAVCCLLLTI